MALELHCDEDAEAEADPVTAQHGSIALDVAFTLEPLDPSQARRRRQAHLVGKLDVAEPGIGLQIGDDPAVDGIQLQFWHGRDVRALQGRNIASGPPWIAQFARTCPRVRVPWLPAAPAMEPTHDRYRDPRGVARSGR